MIGMLGLVVDDLRLGRRVSCLYHLEVVWADGALALCPAMNDGIRFYLEYRGA
jgi:hypothetical protein